MEKNEKKDKKATDILWDGADEIYTASKNRDITRVKERELKGFDNADLLDSIRSELNSLSSHGYNTLIEISKLLLQCQDPRLYNTYNNILKTLADIQSKKLDTIQSKTNNTGNQLQVNIGTTAGGKDISTADILTTLEDEDNSE